MYTFKVKIIPITDIRGPIPTNKNKALIEQYIRNGWIRKEDEEAFRHVDRVFKRAVIDGEPKAVLIKRHIMSPVRQAMEKLNRIMIQKKMAEGYTEQEAKKALRKNLISKEDIQFDIITEVNVPVIGETVECESEYAIVEPELPIVQTRNINSTGKLETFEVITPAHYIEFKVRAANPPIFKTCLEFAGIDIGLFGKRKDGYGKFRVEYPDL